MIQKLQFMIFNKLIQELTSPLKTVQSKIEFQGKSNMFKKILSL